MKAIYLVFNFVLLIVWFVVRFKNKNAVIILIIAYQIRIMLPLADFEGKKFTEDRE